MPKIFTSITQKKGKLGEDIAVRFLVKHGFSVIDRNVTKKWGEIDIVAQKDKVLHFIEVKSVSFDFTILDETTRYKQYIRPEENMTFHKIEKMKRTIEGYLAFSNVPRETKWQVDILCVYLDDINKKAQVRPMWNIIL